MAGRIVKNLSSLENRAVVVSGSFTVATPPVIQEGNGFTVARGGAGDYTVTLDDRWAALVSADVGLEVPAASVAASVSDAQLADNDVVSAKTVDIRVWQVTPNLLVDVTAAVVHFAFTLRNSKI